MKWFPSLLLALHLGLFSSAQSSAQVVVDAGTLSGDYNPANTIASVATGSSSTVAEFTSTMTSAFASGQGAVWGFNGGPGINGTDWDIDFGTGKSLNISTSAVVAYLDFSTAGFTSPSTSGGNMFAVNNGEPDRSGFTMDFALSGAGLAPNEFITEIGFAALNRSSGNTPTYTVTATLDDASTIVLTETIAVGAVDSNNVHFGIQATPGRHIVSLAIETDAASSQIAAIDDFGFVTAVVPEPSTTALLLGVAGMSLLRRRSRR